MGLRRESVGTSVSSGISPIFACGLGGGPMPLWKRIPAALPYPISSDSFAAALQGVSVDRKDEISGLTIFVADHVEQLAHRCRSNVIQR
jgi:hypothetical protein